MAIRKRNKAFSRLPKTFAGLTRLVPPKRLRDDSQHKQAIQIIDRLMRIETLSSGQSRYMKALLNLVEAYEAKHHAIDLSDCDSWTPGFFERLEHPDVDLTSTVDEMLRQIQRSRS